jgi:outer membrane receptor protein involved in Fe transport
MKSIQQKFLFSTVLLGAMSAHQPAVAQDDDGSSGPIENIVVTAQKREQSIDDVGLTIQVASGEELDERGIDGVEDLSKLVPGFTFTQSIYSTPVFTLRGIGLYDATFGAAPSVSIYTDQIPRNVPVMSDALDLDIARVEVLKGPQGTLFGQSSTGGAINYIVAKPTAEFDAGFNASLEKFDYFELSAFVSGPLSDTVRGRIAVKSENSGDWQYSDSRRNDTNGEARKIMGRAILEIEPSDGFRAELMVTAVDDRFDGTFVGRQSTLVDRLNGTDQALADGARAILGTPLTPKDPRIAEWTPGLVGKSDNSYFQVAARLDFDLSDSLTLTSLTSYADKELDYGQDLDASTAIAVDVPIFGDVTAFNQELRLSHTSEQLNWILGATYDDIESNQTNLFGLSDYSANTAIPGLPITLTTNEFGTVLETFAVFANVEYAISPQFSIQGGVRYTDNQQDAEYCYNDQTAEQYTAQTFSVFNDLFTGMMNPPIQPGECFPLGDGLQGTTFGRSTLDPVVRELDEDNLSFRVGANYKFDQGTLLYFTASRGFKTGVFSAIGASSTSQYVEAPQEEVLAYEAGIKAPLADGRVSLNGAVFFYDYKDKQVRGRTLDPIFGLLEKMINVPDSEIFGVEAEIVARPTEGLTFSLSATYLDSEVTSDFSMTPDGQAVYNAQGYTGNFNGSILPYTPEFSATGYFKYEFPLTGSLNGFFGATVRHQGEQNATFVNSILLADEFEIPDFTTIDVRAGIASNDGKWQLAAYGENVSDESYSTAVSTFLDTRLRYYGRPAIYGVSFSLNY